uniref:Uncharacterized protein n=1 Tax=Geospiza parvula TaxID=87175 RepID=A0A8C3MVI9_GEOPR
MITALGDDKSKPLVPPVLHTSPSFPIPCAPDSRVPKSLAEGAAGAASKLSLPRRPGLWAPPATLPGSLGNQLPVQTEITRCECPSSARQPGEPWSWPWQPGEPCWWPWQLKEPWSWPWQPGEPCWWPWQLKEPWSWPWQPGELWSWPWQPEEPCSWPWQLKEPWSWPWQPGEPCSWPWQPEEPCPHLSAQKPLPSLSAPSACDADIADELTANT